MFEVLRIKPKDISIYAGLIFLFLQFIPISAFALTSLYVRTGNLSPDSGTVSTGQPIIFNSTYYDSKGWKQINSARFMVNTNMFFFKNCLCAVYEPQSNKLYLLDDNGKKYIGGFVPGSNKAIENSYCRLDCSKSSVLGSGNTLTVNWAVSFKPSFTGKKRLYLYVQDKKGGYDGWDRKGKLIIVVDNIAPTGSVKINNNSVYTNSTTVNLNLSAVDNACGTGVSQMQLSNDDSQWPVPESYANTKVWNLTSGDGIKTVYVKFKDNAGNWSQAYSATVTLDTTSPRIDITSPYDNEVFRPQP